MTCSNSIWKAANQSKDWRIRRRKRYVLHVYCTDAYNISFSTHYSTRYDKCDWQHVNIYLSLAPIFFFFKFMRLLNFCSFFFVRVSLFASFLSFNSTFDRPFVPSPFVHEVYSIVQPFAWHCQLSFTRQSPLSDRCLIISASNAKISSSGLTSATH